VLAARRLQCRRLINSGVDLRDGVPYNSMFDTRIGLSRTHLYGTKPPHSESQVAPEEVIVRQGVRTHRLKYFRGETLLETLRRGGVPAPSLCEQGVCGTCMVKRVKGNVMLRENHVLSDQDLAAGYILACQGVPCDAVCEIEIV